MKPQGPTGYTANWGYEPFVICDHPDLAPPPVLDWGIDEFILTRVESAPPCCSAPLTAKLRPWTGTRWQARRRLIAQRLWTAADTGWWWLLRWTFRGGHDQLVASLLDPVRRRRQRADHRFWQTKVRRGTFPLKGVYQGRI